MNAIPVTFENHRIQHFGAIGHGVLPPPQYLTEVGSRWSKAFGKQVFYYRFVSRDEFDKCMHDPSHPYHPKP